MAYTSPYPSKGKVQYGTNIYDIAGSRTVPRSKSTIKTTSGTGAIPQGVLETGTGLLAQGYQQAMGKTSPIFQAWQSRLAPTQPAQPTQATQVGGLQSEAILEQQRRAEELRNMILGGGTTQQSTTGRGTFTGLPSNYIGPGAPPTIGRPAPQPGAPGFDAQGNMIGGVIYPGGTPQPTYPGTPGGLLEQQLIGKTLQPGIGQGTIQGMKTQASDLIAEQQRQAAGQQVGAYGGAGSYGGRLRSGLGEIERGGELARQKGMTDIDVQTAIYNDKASMDALGQLQTYVNSLTQKEQYGQQLSLQERQLLEQIKQSGIGNMMQLYQSQQTPDWLSLLTPGGVPQDALTELLKATYY